MHRTCTAAGSVARTILTGCARPPLLPPGRLPRSAASRSLEQVRCAKSLAGKVARLSSMIPRPGSTSAAQGQAGEKQAAGEKGKKKDNSRSVHKAMMADVRQRAKLKIMREQPEYTGRFRANNIKAIKRVERIRPSPRGEKIQVEEARKDERMQKLLRVRARIAEMEKGHMPMREQGEEDEHMSLREQEEEDEEGSIREEDEEASIREEDEEASIREEDEEASIRQEEEDEVEEDEEYFEDEDDDGEDPKPNERPRVRTDTKQPEGPAVATLFSWKELADERMALLNCYGSQWTPYGQRQPTKLSSLLDKNFTYQRKRFPNTLEGRKVLAEVIGNKRKWGMRMCDFDWRILMYRYGMGFSQWSKFAVHLHRDRQRVIGWPDNCPKVGQPKGKAGWRAEKSAELLLAIWHGEIKVVDWAPQEIASKFPPVLIMASEREFLTYEDKIKKHLREEAAEIAKDERKRDRMLREREKRQERLIKREERRRERNSMVMKEKMDFKMLHESLTVATEDKPPEPIITPLPDAPPPNW
ncbi:hypothetical protein CALVIDRAFT_541102 [Calocera viscosa TUFC12733]|uniref:Uncharacterized protein n=1 Tax=Calocera viscosa (strain TUFC12733) TaxID=1330018 RepID=A0A167I415_CALVF|nr:hypothetical protein CALVIDRAFT_541102 [Calocera viscosa TUFC12733]